MKKVAENNNNFNSDIISVIAHLLLYETKTAESFIPDAALSPAEKALKPVANLQTNRTENKMLLCSVFFKSSIC